MRRFFNFGKKEYQEPQISPIPEDQESKQSGTYINESKRHIRIEIYDCGQPDDLSKALGTLRISEDVVKQTLSIWHMKDRQRKGIFVPNGKSNGGLHVQ